MQKIKVLEEVQMHSVGMVEMEEVCLFGIVGTGGNTYGYMNGDTGYDYGSGGGGKGNSGAGGGSGADGVVIVEW